ncbi:Protein of uncharacterised function (DUF1342) [Chromobacterium violaceum]|uniref:Protein of uncharacterized function (DUF1342) n=1 Tax=Chromobacterium violaceum TaxID=536 RepID=A0A447TJP9_CHRVL|nr:Protein of uncharacterised function (DUF1342) [Chromobacterium violaceum]
METASRADLKADLLQELERQKQMLEALRDNPNVAEETLEGVLEEIERASSQLLALTGKFGQNLRENEWLMAIKQRAGIPGGTCQFDLPSYHLWQQRSAEVRRQDLRRWAAPLMPPPTRPKSCCICCATAARPTITWRARARSSRCPAARWCS